MRFQLLLCLFVALCGRRMLVEGKRIKPVSLTAMSSLDIRGGSSDDALDWRYFLAGGICAATSHGITTPIDVVKTRMQTNPEKYNKGVIAAASDIIATEGPMFLLAGLAPTVVGYGFEGALKFGFYETFKRIFKDLTKHQVVNYLAASVVAGAVASVVLCPMEDTRIRMVGDPTYAKENLVSALIRMIREDGLLKTFTGLGAMLSKQIPYTMTKQVSFIIAKMLYGVAEKASFKAADIKLVISIMSAFFSSILSCLGSQPGDMILTAFYKNHGQKSFPTIISDIYNAHGLGGFYLGTVARLMHVSLIITSQLVLYDIIKQALGLPPSGGSH